MAISPTYNYAAVGDNDKLIRLSDQGHSETLHFDGHFLTSLQNTQTYFNEAHHSCLLADTDDTGDVLRSSGSIKVQAAPRTEILWTR